MSRQRGQRFGRTAQSSAEMVWVILPTPSDQVVLECVSGGCRPRRQVQFQQDVADVSVDGALAVGELARNLAIRPPFGDEPDHLELAGRQYMRNGGPLRFAQFGDPCQVRLRRYPLEELSGRVELEGRRDGVA
jgi:hypothetical protein